MGVSPRRLNNKAQWLKPEPLPENINSGLETSASIYKDPFTEEEDPVDSKQPARHPR